MLPFFIMSSAYFLEVEKNVTRANNLDALLIFKWLSFDNILKKWKTNNSTKEYQQIS